MEAWPYDIGEAYDKQPNGQSQCHITVDCHSVVLQAYLQGEEEHNRERPEQTIKPAMVKLCPEIGLRQRKAEDGRQCAND